MIRPVTVADYSALCEIYNYYIEHTTVTFDIEKLSIADVQTKLERNWKYPCVVCEQDGVIVGFAAASEWKAKKAYQQTVELSVYLRPDSYKNGYGSSLYSELIDILRSQGIHSIISGIIMPNHQSIALHDKFRFKKVAHFSEVGYKFDKWFDVTYWQLML
jgi:phosphinothricin acetyltransferase